MRTAPRNILGDESATRWTFAWQNLITRPSRTALATIGLTIPVLAFLGLFSISQGIRDLMGAPSARCRA